MAIAGPWFWTMVKIGGKGRSSWKAGDRVFARVTGKGYQVWDGRKHVARFPQPVFDERFEAGMVAGVVNFCLDQRYICKSLQRMLEAKGRGEVR